MTGVSVEVNKVASVKLEDSKVVPTEAVKSDCSPKDVHEDANKTDSPDTDNDSAEVDGDSSEGKDSGDKKKRDIAQRWSVEEHELFLKGLEMYGRSWKKISQVVKTRTTVQIRTHAQKYLIKLDKARRLGHEGPVQMDGKGFGGLKRKLQEQEMERQLKESAAWRMQYPPYAYAYPMAHHGMPLSPHQVHYPQLLRNNMVKLNIDDGSINGPVTYSPTSVVANHPSLSGQNTPYYTFFPSTGLPSYSHMQYQNSHSATASPGMSPNSSPVHMHSGMIPHVSSTLSSGITTNPSEENMNKITLHHQNSSHTISSNNNNNNNNNYLNQMRKKMKLETQESDVTQSDVSSLSDAFVGDAPEDTNFSDFILDNFGDDIIDDPMLSGHHAPQLIAGNPFDY